MSNTANPYARVLAASGTEAIDAIIAGLASEDNGFFLSAEQMTNIEASLAAAEENTGAIATITEQRDAFERQAGEATEQLAIANESIAALQNEIAQMKASDATNGSDAGASADRSDAADPSAKFLTSVDRERAERKAKYGI